MGRLTENSVLNIKNKSHAVTAEIVVPEGGAEGVIIAQGGAFGGWSLYVKEGKPGVLLQPLRPAAVQGLRRAAAIPPATHQVRMEFAYDGGGLGKGGDVDALRRRRAGRRGPRRRRPCRCSSRPTRRCDVGRDTASPVSDDYTPEDSAFTGTVSWVQIDIGEAAEDPTT